MYMYIDIRIDIYCLYTSVAIDMPVLGHTSQLVTTTSKTALYSGALAQVRLILVPVRIKRVYTYMCVYLYIHMYTKTSIYIYLYIYIYMCVYIYICIYVHRYICTTYTWKIIRYAHLRVRMCY